MRKKALKKNFFMEIRTSMNRFISILFIVALGVAFLSGIRASEPDMRYSGDAYFDKRNMMDFRVMGTLGLTESDVESIRNIPGVSAAEPGYRQDVLCRIGERGLVVHVESMPDTMNQIDVCEGRMPQKEGEIIIDADKAARNNILVGDTLTFLSGTDDPLSDSFKMDIFTVTGTCTSPTYISFDRGSTTIGSGEIELFAYTPAESFSQKVFSQIYVQAEGAKEAVSFTKVYDDIIQKVEKELKNISGGRCEIRYDEVMDEANKEINDAQRELDDARNDAESELADAKKELEDGEKELADGKETLTDAAAQLEDGKKMLADSRDTLDSGWASYNSGYAQLEDGKSELDKAWKELNSHEKELEDAEQQLAGVQEELISQEADLIQAEEGLAEAKRVMAMAGGMEVSQEIYDQMLAEIEEGKAQIEELQAQYSQLEEEGDHEEELAVLTQQINDLTRDVAQAEADAQMYAQLLPLQAVLDREDEIIASRQQLEAGKKALQENKETLEASRIELENGKAKLEDEAQKINVAEQKLQVSHSQLVQGESDYKAGQNEIDENEQKLKDGYNEIAENEQKLQDGWQEYEDGKKEADEKISDAESKLADAREVVSEIEVPEWIIQIRSDDADYKGYSDNADRMKAIGSVFPLLFFMVAALVSLTTMTRMVEEQRTQIGTLKALGYSRGVIAGKYVGYALCATFAGSILGVLLGQKIFPYIIVVSYKIMYTHIPDVVIPYDLRYSLIAASAAVCCTLAATLFACFNELRAQPSELMRPQAPKAGKRIFLEHIPFIWNRLNFTRKSTLRNMLRYKKRFFMTVFGIGGCMALMVCGFGLKNSIMDVARYQYKKIQVYDMMLILDDARTDNQQQEIQEKLSQDPDIMASKAGSMRLLKSEANGVKKDIYLYVPETIEQLDSFIHFGHRTKNDQYHMQNDSAILTEKAADLMGVSIGDSIQMQVSDEKSIEVTITDICENYLEHYLYMSPYLYETLTGEKADNNCILAEVKDEAKDKIEDIGADYIQNKGVLTVSYTNNIEERLDQMLSTLDLVIIVLIISAGMLAFVVLYNLNNININERKRELATLKVLGFYDREVSEYVYRENILLTLLGMLVGCGIGRILHRFVVETVEVEMTMFGRDAGIKSYVYSMLFTVAFSILVNIAMHYKLKKINMVESLKSVE